MSKFRQLTAEVIVIESNIVMKGISFAIRNIASVYTTIAIRTQVYSGPVSRTRESVFQFNASSIGAINIVV